MISFDQLVGTGDQDRGHGQSERLGGLEIDHQVEIRGRLHRKLSRLGTLEDAIDVGWCPPVQVEEIGAIRDEAPIGCELRC